LLEYKYEKIQMKCISNLNYAVQHLAFEVNGQYIWAMHHDLETMIPTFVIESVYVIVESLMNNQRKGEFLELFFCIV
jgi:hypothetical protein